MTLSREPARDHGKEAQAPSLVSARPPGVATFQACVERASEVHAAGPFRRPAGREGGAGRKARFRFRAAVAPLVLAAYTLVAALGAVLALAPPALRGGPLGRRRTARGAAPDLGPAPVDRLEPVHPAPSAAEEREALGG